MITDVIVFLLAASTFSNAIGIAKNQVEKDSLFEKENSVSRKVKRWTPGLHDNAADYPEFDDFFADNQLEEARPFTTSPGSTIFYRPGSRRQSGAVTRTVFNPPSGFIPRVFAAAKAAIATLTGPQTVLSRTTYLSAPRPGITALHVPQVATQNGGITSSSSNAAAAAAAAAAAVAAVTRSIYEAAGHRESGFYEKDSYLPPTTYNNYGIWSAPLRSPWASLHPPDIVSGVPYDGWKDRGRPNPTESYGPPPMWFKQNYVPSITTDNIRQLPWLDNNFNTVSRNQDGWNIYRNRWTDYNQNHRGWADKEINNVWLDEKQTRSAYGRGAESNGGYASATADKPPNGDSFADAKVTANGASAVAAAVWDLRSVMARETDSEKKKAEYLYSPNEDEKGFGRESKKLGERHEAGDLGRLDSGDGKKYVKDRKTSACGGDDDRCSLPKTTVQRLRELFPRRRKS